MASDDIQRMIDELGSRLGRSVVVNDPDMHMLYTSGHFGDEDDVRVHAVLHRGAAAQAVGYVLAQGVTGWTTPGVIPAKADIGMSARVCFPMRWRGELIGLAMVMDAASTLTTGEMDLVVSVLDEIAALMIDRREQSVAEDAADEARVMDLLGDRPRARALAIDELRTDGRLPDLPHVRVTVVLAHGVHDADASHADTAIRHAFRAVKGSQRGTTMTAVGRGRGAMVQFTSSPVDDLTARQQARALVAQVDDVSAGRFAGTAGIGDSGEGVEDAWLSRRQADISARAVRVLGLPGAATWDELGVFSTLLRIPADELDRSIIPSPLRRLLAADRRGHLVETLEAYLDSGCSGPAASEALHIHRTTLYYRLDRIRELADLDLDDGGVRLVVHLGLKALRLVRP